MAAWKKKEKPLTAEEAVALARKELKPYWYGSEPLLAALKGPDGQVHAHPLDPEFLKKPRLIFLFDPTVFSGEEMMLYIREWHRRYHVHGVEFLLIFRPTYQFQRTRAEMERMAQKRKLPQPLVLDQDGLLASAFGATALPKLLLFHQNRFLWQTQGSKWTEGAELHLQQFLRSTDPGLALLPIFDPDTSVGKPLQDQGRVEFGKAGAASWATASVRIQGRYQQDAEKIVIADPGAAIRFVSPGKQVMLIAESQAKIGEESRIEVMVDDSPAWDEIQGEHLSLRDEGMSVLPLEKADLYQILVELPAAHRQITLRFSNADRGPVGIYGLRFGG